MAGQRRIESEIVSLAIGVPRQLPVDICRIAVDIGVGDIRWTNNLHGFTDFRPSAPVIYLNYSQLRTTEWRFVFAHELAHVMLRMPEVLRLIQMRDRTSLLVDEEMFADNIAATILVPDSLIEEVRACRPLERLRCIAQRADVSMATLVARMASSDIDIALLHWHRRNGVWHVIDRPGTPSGLHGYVKPSAAGHLALANLDCGESHVVVDCYINGRHAKISGRGYRSEEQAFVLLEPSIDIWIGPPKRIGSNLEPDLCP